MSTNRLICFSRNFGKSYLQRAAQIRQHPVVLREITRRFLVTKSDVHSISALRHGVSTFDGTFTKSNKRYYSVNLENLEISTEQVRKELDHGNDLYIIDVRETDEVEAYGKIENAKLMPLSELESALNMSEETFQTKYGYEKPSEDGDDVIFYCQAGVRSMRATMFARSIGFDMSKSLTGGYIAWLKDQES